MNWPVDQPKEKPRRRQNFAAAVGMTDVDAFDNVVRAVALTYAGDNAAHQIKGTYDENHQPTKTTPDQPPGAEP